MIVKPARPIELRTRLLAAAVWMIALAQATLVLAEPEPVPPEWLADAELTDVCFLDPDRGWAVGDRGVIWRTDDGGRHWRLDESPVTCRLNAISVARGQAFAVGGFSHPLTFKSSGVVLHTREGTRRWEQVKSSALPALNHVKFLDSRTGWAVGNGSALYPTGLFKTEDGGRSWASIPSSTSAGWRAADFRDSKTGALAGQEGSVSLIVPAGLKPAQHVDLGARGARRIRLWGSHGGWLVGDGGLVLATTDGGHTWNRPASGLPAGVESEFDFRALAIYEKHVWIAGAPGTCVFHSGDGGQTWDQFRTDQPLPLGSLMFLNEHRGWAVGALGTILATTDGGRTWRKQHGGATRASLVGFFGEAQAVPLELLARLSGDEGYLSAVEILGQRPAVESEGRESPPEARDREALSSLGVSATGTAWRFPLELSGVNLAAGALLKNLDAANDGQAVARLEAHLVRKIRQWRPEVIVTEAAGARGAPLPRLMYQTVLTAVEKAAEAEQYPAQASLAGLSPWKVRKVVGALPEGERGSLTLNTAQLAPRLGRSLADQASAARGLLFTHYQEAPNMLSLTMPMNRMASELGERDVFAGVLLSPGGEARRLVGQPAAASLDALQRLAQKQRNIRQLLAHSASGPGQGAAWLAQIEQLTSGLPAASAGEMLFQLGYNYHAGGQGDLAAEAWELLVERHPDHALTEAALVWLVQYHASSEAAHRRRGPGFTPAEATQDYVLTSDPPTMAKMAVAAPESGRRPKNKAVELARRVEQLRPALYADPLVRFPLAAAQRTNGERRIAESYYQSVAEIRPRDAWWAAASSEKWLSKPGPVCPKPLWRCAAASSRPRLNGVLDDEIWKSAKAVDLTSPAGDDERWPAQAMLACDREFLYLAVRCFKAPGVNYSASTEARPRDADLSGQDRVELFLDLDRDYTTFYRLSVDYRGWTSEACLDDETWNPTWYVAAGGDEAEWIVEAAIPLAELAPRAPDKRDAWAVGVQRVVPAAGFQSFSKPAAVAPRGEGFGLLLFE